MTEDEFIYQMKRLENEFSSKHFGYERLNRIKQCVMDLTPYGFSRVIDHMIDNFRQAPLPKDFREAARAERNAYADLRSIPAIMHSNFKGDGALLRVMEKEYPGCKTLWEAVEVQKIKNKVEAANARK